MLGPMRRGAKLAASTLFAVALVAALGSGPEPGIAASSGAYGGFTGAPGEDTCRHCHDTFPLNSAVGTMTLEGFPETYVPGERYPVTVTLASESGLKWGFQATVLTANGKRVGKLVATDRKLTKVVPGIFFETRSYVEQRGAGSFEGQRGGASWAFDWKAPKRDKGPVTIYVAGNVGNANGDMTGDFIYYLERTAQPAGN